MTSINLEYIAEQQEFVRGVLGQTQGRHRPAGVHRSRRRSRGRRRAAGGRRAHSRRSSCRCSASAPCCSPRTSSIGSSKQYLRTARHAVVLGHAGADPRLHDAAGQRRQDAGQRPAERRPLSRRAVRHLRDAGEPDAARIGWRSSATSRWRARSRRTSRRWKGKDPIATILDYARAHGITQIFVGHNIRHGWRDRLGGTPLDRLIRDAEGIDVRVFPQ